MVKYIKRAFAAILTISLITVLVACGSNTNTGSNTSTNNTQPQTNQTTTISNKTFTKAELKKYDGKNGNPAYVAVNGIVYDVTNARGWNGGQHHGYQAGVDLSKEITKAPHGTSVLKNLPVVGKYKG